LTTNAVKYGCWSSGGLLHVDWREDGDHLEIRWREDCPGKAMEPERQGFGSLLMSGAAKQLGGTIDRTFTEDGVRVAISLPRAG
jgi:two-component sensor histidine kinase